MSDVTVTFGAKDEGLKSAISSAEKGVATLSKAFGTLGIAAAALGGAKMAFDAFKGLADYAGGISDIAAQTGMSAEATMVWGQALKNAGLDAGALGGLVNKLQRALAGVNEEGEPTNKAFERLGLNMANLRAMKPEQQMETVAAAIAAIPDPAERAAAAMELFGKSGGKALVLFTDSGALSTAREQLGDLAENLGANIATLDKLSDALNSAGEIKSLQIMAGFAKGFSGDMNTAADALNRMDLSKAGEEMGLIARGARELVAELGKLPGGSNVLSGVTKAAEVGAFGPLVQAGMAGASSLRKKGAAAIAGEAVLDGEGDPGNGFEETVKAVETANIGLGSSLSLMTDLSDISTTNLSLQDSYSSSLEGAAEQMAIGIELQNDLNEAKEREVELAKEAAEEEKKKLQDLKAQTNERLSAAKSQLSTIAGADVPAIGERGSRARAAKKAMSLEEKAAEAEAFGDTDKAKKLREKASEARKKAFGGEDKVSTTEKTLQSIDSRLETLNTKLPTPALAP
jgi:hypothetical protein